MSRHTVRYQVIGRSIVERPGALDQHSLKLLYRGDGSPWWTVSAGLELIVPPDFEVTLGGFVAVTLEVLT